MRSHLLFLGLAFGLGACFGDTQQPSAYRFDCKSDGDCKDPEQCIEGLCQIPCTFASFEDDCPAEQNFVSCFNGVCSNLCELDDGAACPGAQSCVEVPFDPGAVGGGFGGVDVSNLGVCGIKCTDGSCPDGELCLEGICIPLEGGETGGTGGDTTGDTGGTGN